MPRAMAYNTRVTDIPEIQTIGQIRFFDAHEPMPEEAHTDAFELLYILSGRKTMRVKETEYELSGGDLLVIAPDEVHGANSFIQTRTTIDYLIICNPARLPGFCGMEDDERRLLVDRLNAMPARKVVLSAEGQRLMRMFQRPFDGPFHRARQRAALTALLWEIIRPQDILTAELPEDIRCAVELIASKSEEILSVGELASHVNLSEPRFKQKFKQAIGVPPAEYIAREKIASAKDKLIHTADRITDIAMSLGFGSSQHFSVLFKRYTGITPIEYRKTARKPSHGYDDTH